MENVGHKSQLPVVIIGAGPVGLMAAVHLIQRDQPVIVLERGPAVGHAIQQWGHVRLFTPWRYLIEDSAAAMLSETDWRMPEAEAMPTGAELVERYLKPLAQLPKMQAVLRYGKTVQHVVKRGLSKNSGRGRAAQPYRVYYETANGGHGHYDARAVIDASGTWFNPNPIGVEGVHVPGEQENSSRIVYGIPDVLGGCRADYAGASTLVLGSGHSAINTVLDLVKLADAHPGTRIIWGNRSDNRQKLAGGGDADELAARGALGTSALAALERPDVNLLAPMEVTKIEELPGGLEVHAIVAGEQRVFSVDRIVVATGFRPDLDMLRELRLDIDDVVEAPVKLAPLIDPNQHSCGTVEPHGVDELAHPDTGIYVVGMKSYGRAPTFLMMTGYEQVRSIADELAGDFEAARKVQLTLPETGVCSAPSLAVSSAGEQPTNSGDGCCGGVAEAADPTPEEVSAGSSCCG